MARPGLGTVSPFGVDRHRRAGGQPRCLPHLLRGGGAAGPGHSLSRPSRENPADSGIAHGSVTCHGSPSCTFKLVVCRSCPPIGHRELLPRGPWPRERSGCLVWPIGRRGRGRGACGRSKASDQSRFREAPYETSETRGSRATHRRSVMSNAPRCCHSSAVRGIQSTVFLHPRRRLS